MNSIPSDWREERIGTIFKPKSNGIIPQSYPEEYFAYYSLPNFDLGKNAIETLGKNIESNKYEFNGEAVLISKLNPRKPRVWYVNEESSKRKICSTEFVVLNNPTKNCYPGYFSFYLGSDLIISRLESLASGSTNSHNRFQPKEFFKLKVPLPTIKEQKKIAQILTSVDKVIELTEIEIEKLKNLKKGMMQDLLTKGIGHTKFKDSPIGKIPESWESKIIKDVTAMITKGATPTTYGYDYMDYGVKFYRSVNATMEGEINLYDIKYISSEASNSQKRSILQVGDILLSIVGAQTGKTLFMISSENELPGNINQNISLVRSDREQVLPKYLKLFLQSELFYAQLGIELTTQAQPSLSLEQVGNFKLPLPSIDEQKKNVMYIDSIIKKINLKNKILKRNIELKKGLMQDLLTGKVRVKV